MDLETFLSPTKTVLLQLLSQCIYMHTCRLIEILAWKKRKGKVCKVCYCCFAGSALAVQTNWPNLESIGM